MKAILFDPFSGASGDMSTAALIDLGADADKVKDYMEIAANVDVKISRTTKKGISVHEVKVITRKEGSLTLKEIIKRISALAFPSEIINDATSVFTILGKAESKVHGEALQNMHFHELGQEDAIADIVGSCSAYYDLGLKEYRIYSTPVSVGEGFIEFSHGKFPVPAPAALEILKEYSLPWQTGPVEGELLTPTGAALLAHFVNEKGACPPMKVERIGYGAGRKDLFVPNVLRIIRGEVDDSLISERIEMLETNVDDVTGQVLGNLIDSLLKEGAKDVAIIPATMKKGRSGHIIQVIAKPEDSGKLTRKIIEETGSLGVRLIPIKHRLIANREMDKIELEIGKETFSISIKIARDKHYILLNISAEFEDCRKASLKSGLPVRDVIRMAEEEARRVFSSARA
ncbi:MAG: nickel pincer cofactor biosynthesis protein LarC [Candidatus Methanoperedens sp.]|nr:nickel pincer cofactor biosynthesis protein LarC [Candidatus Methanoperedens sp.]MCE8428745.1 nickel pincer cofactor biosynthesis protein LarC [Candidatus Methanoperedens sp.]